jgi:hypothetical protein
MMMRTRQIPQILPRNSSKNGGNPLAGINSHGELNKINSHRNLIQASAAENQFSRHGLHGGLDGTNSHKLIPPFNSAAEIESGMGSIGAKFAGHRDHSENPSIQMINNSMN